MANAPAPLLALPDLQPQHLLQLLLLLHNPVQSRLLY
jgi:hypothetical protein